MSPPLDNAAHTAIDNIPLDAIDVSDPQIYQDDTWSPYFARLRRELAPLESDGKVIGETTSNIILANC